MAAPELQLLTDIALQCDIIGIDDAHLFNDVVSWCDNMANAGKVLIVAFRDGTVQRKPNSDVIGMVSVAEEVVKLRAVCMNEDCVQEAAFSRIRKGRGEAVCRSCVIKTCRVQEENEKKPSDLDNAKKKIHLATEQPPSHPQEADNGVSWMSGGGELGVKPSDLDTAQHSHPLEVDIGVSQSSAGRKLDKSKRDMEIKKNGQTNDGVLNESRKDVKFKSKKVQEPIYYKRNLDRQADVEGGNAKKKIHLATAQPPSHPQEADNGVSWMSGGGELGVTRVCLKSKKKKVTYEKKAQLSKFLVKEYHQEVVDTKKADKQLISRKAKKDKKPQKKERDILKCSLCPKTFTCPSNKRNHEIIAHGNAKKYGDIVKKYFIGNDCTICSKTVKFSRNRVTHLGSHHFELLMGSSSEATGIDDIVVTKAVEVKLFKERKEYTPVDELLGSSPESSPLKTKVVDNMDITTNMRDDAEKNEDIIDEWKSNHPDAAQAQPPSPPWEVDNGVNRTSGEDVLGESSRRNKSAADSSDNDDLVIDEQADISNESFEDEGGQVDETRHLNQERRKEIEIEEKMIEERLRKLTGISLKKL